MSFSVKPNGDWSKAQAALGTKLPVLMRRALLQEAQLGERIMKHYVTNASGKVAALSPWTIAGRKLAKPAITGTKPLVARGDMRNSITNRVSGAEMFVGILRTAKSRDGKNLYDLAMLHEQGKTIVIRITPKMRKFMGVLASMVKGSSKSSGGGGGGSAKEFLVIHIPKRPFIAPSFEHWSLGTGPAMLKYAGVPAEQRMVMRIAALAQGALGTP